MTISEDVLRKQLTEAMAVAVDEADTYQAFFGDPTDREDFGVARADGVMPADMVFLWDFAGHIAQYVAAHGVDVLDIVEQVGNLFVAYLAVKKPSTDFDASDQEKIKAAVIETLKDLTDSNR